MPVSKEKQPEDEKRFTVRISRDMHYKAKLLSLELNESMQDLIKEGLELVFKKHNKSFERSKKIS